MRRALALGAIVVAFGCGGAFAFGCGGSDASIAGGGDDGGSGNDATTQSDGTSGSDSSTGNDGGGGNDGSSGNDGGGNTDGGNGGVDGGFPSNPGLVNCGSTTCSTTTDYCCIRFQFDGGVADAGCVADDAGIGACQGTRVHCNEAADCPTNQICCAEFGGTVAGGTTCRTPGNNPQDPCGIGGVQVCRTTTECGAQGACNVLTCGTRQLEVCGKPQGCQ